MEAGSSSLQKEIHHPAHGHSGSLTFSFHRGNADSLCSICGDVLGGLEPIYRCPDPDCDFKLDLRCSSIKSVIEFEAHRQHPLCFIERYGPGISCRWCQNEYPGLPMFRCGECGFSLHLLCGPLPRAILYKNYELTLTDSVIEGTGSDDCWCHICEEKRDPGKCVYHSPEVPFTASIKCCLLPQIINLLKGDLGDVELRTAGRHIPGKVIGRIQVENYSQPLEARTELYGDDVVQEAESSSKTSSNPLEEEEEFSADGETSMQFIDTPVSTDSDEGTEPNRAETELYGDEVVQEADSSSEPYSDQVDGEEVFSAEMEEIFGNFFSGFAEGLLESLAEASKEFMDILGSSDSVKPKKGKSKTYRDEGSEEAGTSTAADEWIRGLSLDSYQFLRSLGENEADEFEDFLNANAKLIGKSKATGNFPLLDDAAQRFKEQLDISLLEEDVQLNKSQSMTGDEEEVEELNLTYVQMMRKMTPQDRELINEAFEKCTKHGEEGEATLSFLYYSNSRPVRTWEFSYSDDAFKKFKEQIDITDRVDNSYLTGWKKYAAKIVRVGNNLIPSQFVSIYREMVEKYGDFSAGSELSPVAKALFFHLLFAVVYSMRGTQVRDINDDLLCTWQYYLRGVQNAGFNIQFALDNLEKLVRAHFGLKVMKFRDETTEKLGKQQEKLQRQIDEKEVKLELLKSIQEKYRKPKEAEDSLVKQCLIEAAKWKWKDVCDLIL